MPYSVSQALSLLMALFSHELLTLEPQSLCFEHA
ncbi:hypothetical protein NEOC95_001659 [Neochlamydia sp. AcF95]|nr:hypothetical protein [Neochlamydia sp. AcF95]